MKTGMKRTLWGGAAAAAVALVVAPLTREYGIDYLIATVLLAGLLQIVLSLLGVARLMRFIPRRVMVGFVNALAILIFIAHLPHLIDVPSVSYTHLQALEYVLDPVSRLLL